MPERDYAKWVKIAGSPEWVERQLKIIRIARIVTFGAFLPAMVALVVYSKIIGRW